MAFYRKIHDLRVDHNLTQDKLAQELKMHKTTYTRYEQGLRELPFEVAIRLADYFQVSLDYLAGRAKDV